jgi:hypothetical protein
LKRRAALVAIAVAGMACNSLLGIEPLPAPAAFDAGEDAKEDVAIDFDSAIDPPDAIRDAGADVARDARHDAKCVPPDGAACTVNPPCGCPSETTCDLLDNGPICSFADDRGEGLACDNEYRCIEGLVCVLGVCSRYCDTPDAGCADAGQCIPKVSDETGQAIPGAFVCSVPCDPVVPESCGGHATDLPTGDPLACGFSASYVPYCRLSINSTTTCVGFSDCAPGYACVRNNPDVCRRWCRFGQNDCDAGTCLATAGSPLVANGYHYGTCSQ